MPFALIHMFMTAIVRQSFRKKTSVIPLNHEKVVKCSAKYIFERIGYILFTLFKLLLTFLISRINGLQSDWCFCLWNRRTFPFEERSPYIFRGSYQWQKS